MSIRQRKSKKSRTGFTYQVYFNYVDSLSGNRKKFSKSGNGIKLKKPNTIG